MTQAIVTAALTLFVGILVFLFGQVMLVLFIERIRIQARTIEEIAETIVHYAREYSSPLKNEQLTSEKLAELRSRADHLRILSARLRATAVTLRYYRLFEWLRLALPRDRVIKASGSLMGLSNIIPPDNDTIKLGIEFRKEVENYLNIKVPENH
jgi:hypothetical protein